MSAPAWDRPGRLWSLWDMINFRVKPLVGAQDLLVQCSILMHSNDKRFCPRLPDMNKNTLRQSMNDLRIELAAPEFDMCRKGVDRVMATLDRTNSTRQIVGELDDLRRRLLDQTESVFCLLLSTQERALYDPPEPLFGPDVKTNSRTCLRILQRRGNV